MARKSLSLPFLSLWKISGSWPHLTLNLSPRDICLFCFAAAFTRNYVFFISSIWPPPLVHYSVIKRGDASFGEGLSSLHTPRLNNCILDKYSFCRVTDNYSSTDASLPRVLLSITFSLRSRSRNRVAIRLDISFDCSSFISMHLLFALPTFPFDFNWRECSMFYLGILIHFPFLVEAILWK